MLPVQEKIVNFAKPASLQSTREEEVKGGNQCCTLQLTKLGHKAVATCCDMLRLALRQERDRKLAACQRLRTKADGAA